jgi:hypothetical protein
MKKVKIPNKLDWENYQEDFNTKSAYKKFFGKSNEEMQASFEGNITLCCDFYYMPMKPLQYYIFGLRNFLLNSDTGPNDKSDEASIYLNVILFHLEKNPEFISPIFDKLKVSINYIAENQALYEADENIYGNFFDRRKKIFQLLEQFTEQS